MNNATRIHLLRLVRAYGTYSDVARHLGITPRWMRRIRAGDITPQSSQKIRLAAINIQLHSLISELGRMGVITPAHLRDAWARLRAIEASTSAHPATSHNPSAITVTKDA